MRVSFVADQAGTSEEDEVLVAGVSSGDQYLIFQRELEGSENIEDWGPYLEYSDQLNGQYRWVKQCRVSRTHLNVDLAKELPSLPGISGFDVQLDISQESYEELLHGLERVFRDGSELIKNA